MSNQQDDGACCGLLFLLFLIFGCCFIMGLGIKFVGWVFS